jgi:hypothetical protein
MNHRKAMALLQEAADGRLNPAERPGLDQHLAQCERCRAYGAGLPVLEDSLRRSLQTRYPESTPDLRPPATALGNVQMPDRRMQMSKSYLRSFSWVVLAALFVFALSWVFRNLTPKPTISQSQTTTPAATRVAVATTAITATLEAAPTPIETQAPTLTPSLASTVTPSVLTSGASPIFPNLNFSLGVALPDGPGTTGVYTQPYPQSASAENVRQLALRLGLDAPLYSYQGEGNNPIYIVSDGFRWLNVSSGTADIFSYYGDYHNILSTSGDAPSYEQALAGATASLEKLGLLDMPYTTEPLPDKPGGVRFSRTLDDRPLVYGIGSNPSLVDLVVVMGSDGQVKELDYSARHFQKSGDYLILSAQQAWQAFLQSQTSRHIRYVVNPAPPQTPHRSWIRYYPAGQRVDLYGYPWVLKPVDAGEAQLVMISNLNLPVTSWVADFPNRVTPYKFLHLWGQLQPDDQGRYGFALEGWEVSALEDLSLTGKIVREGDQAWLETTDQGRLRLPKLPADVPEGVEANVRGVKTAGGSFDWSNIDTGIPADSGAGTLDTCGGGGGGGGGDSFIGGSFSGTKLGSAPGSGETAPAAPTPTSPFKPGDTVDGQTGKVMALQHRYADGHEALEVYLNADPTLPSNQYWQALLTGPQTEALTQLRNLPVRVWGKVTGTGKDNNPVIEVERFEEVYPGLRIQAWLGKWKPVTLEGKEVLLFTARDGQQFVLSSSIQQGKNSAIGVEGDQVIIEGLAEPGKTFGGYPVITENGGRIANKMTDLSGYQIESNVIGLWDEAAAIGPSAHEIRGNATVDKVVLTYATAFLERCANLTATNPSDAPWLVVQPVWRFTGHLDDGRVFEIQVQALPDEYLN